MTPRQSSRGSQRYREVVDGVTGSYASRIRYEGAVTDGRRMNFRERKVVANGVHPDDVEYGCYTVLSRCFEPVMVNLTRGEHDGEHNIREGESRATAKLLNARLIQLALEDTNINLRGAATALEMIIRDERPTWY